MRTKKIKEWLKKSGYKQAQIAKELEISHVAVVLAIQNKSTISRVVAWLREHGCPEEYLNKKRK